MNWLDDESIGDFLASLGRTTLFPVALNRYGVLSSEGRWLGLVVVHRHGFDAFTSRKPKGVRVSSLDSAVAIIELSATAVYHEAEHRLVGEEANDGD